jgi:FkbM family methyltransferase
MMLKTILNESVNLFESPLFKNHFYRGGSFAECLIGQLNSDVFLKERFKDKKDLTIIDVGGNVGLWSIYFSPICKSIITVEPTPSHCEIALELFNLVNKNKNIELLNAAVLDEEGKQVFFTGEINSTMNSFLLDPVHSNQIKVDTYKLKNIIKRKGSKIDFIKIDAEGAEQKIIMDKDFDSFIYDNVDVIYIEIHDHFGANYNDICKKIESLNYKIEKFGDCNIYAYK